MKILVDGSNLCWRAYFIYPNIEGAEEPNGAINGVADMLTTMVRELGGNDIVMVWDDPNGNYYRTQLSNELIKHGRLTKVYKGNRNKNEEDRLAMRKQLPAIARLVTLLGLPQVSKPNQEADDIIAYLVKYFEENTEEDIMVVSKDHDYHQLVSERTRIYDGTDILNAQMIYEKYGYYPNQTILMGALMGDTGDNIEGARGIGEVGAKRLVQEYPTLSKLLSAAKDYKGDDRYMKIASREMFRIGASYLLKKMYPSKGEVKIPAKGRFDFEAVAKFMTKYDVIQVHPLHIQAAFGRK
jgi:DNA polymerase I